MTAAVGQRARRTWGQRTAGRQAARLVVHARLDAVDDPRVVGEGRLGNGSDEKGEAQHPGLRLL